MSLFEKLFGAAENDINSALSGVKAEATKLNDLVTATQSDVVKYWNEVDAKRVAAQMEQARAQAQDPAQKPPRPARPGDTDPKPYVGNTLAQLTKVHDSYVTERNLLAKDIAKLLDEQTQLDAAIGAVQSAIGQLNPSPAKPQATDVAQWTQAQIDKATTDAIASDAVKS